MAVTWLLPDFGLGVDVFNGLRLRDKPLHACHGRVVDPDILLVAPAAQPSSVRLSNQPIGARGQAESATSAVRAVHAALVTLCEGRQSRLSGRALKVDDAKLGRYGWIVMARVVAGHEDGALAHLQAAEPMALRSAAGKPRHEKAQGGTDRAMQSEPVPARWNAGALTL